MPTYQTGRLMATAASLMVLFAIACAIGAAPRPQSTAITITLTGQSMIRSDIRETSPVTVPVVQDLLKGDRLDGSSQSLRHADAQTDPAGSRARTAPPWWLSVRKASSGGSKARSSAIQVLGWAVGRTASTFSR